jgi:hypothetical protein
MNNIETYYEYKKGRRPHDKHRCDICERTYKNAAVLASHKQDVKKGKTKCVTPQTSNDGFIPPQPFNLITTNIGPKSVMHMPSKPFTVEEKLKL